MSKRELQALLLAAHFGSNLAKFRAEGIGSAEYELACRTREALTGGLVGDVLIEPSRKGSDAAENSASCRPPAGSSVHEVDDRGFDMVTAPQAARRLGVSTRRVTQLAAAGRLDAVQLAGRCTSWMIPRSSVERYAAERTMPTSKRSPVAKARTTEAAKR